MSIAGLAFAAVGLIVLVSGDASWLGVSPEADTGPPARIAGTVIFAFGLLLLIAGRLFASRPKQ